MTQFENELDAPVSIVRYRTDETGLITEARQFITIAQMARLVGEEVPTNDSMTMRNQSHVELFCVDFTYDQSGRLINCVTKYQGAVVEDRRLNYNERGDIVESTSSTDDRVRFEYLYDQGGNWTRRTTLHQSGSDVVVREIDYFQPEPPC